MFIIPQAFRPNNLFLQIAIVSALILLAMERIELVAAIIIWIYSAVIWIYTHPSKASARLQSLPFIVVISLALLAHKVPGFHNILYFQAIKLSELSTPYTLYVNFDKPFLMLLLLYYYKNSASKLTLERSVYSALNISAIAVVVLSISGLITGYIKFDLKTPAIILPWIATNLIAVVAEEAFFRGFLYSSMVEALGVEKINKTARQLIPLVVSSALFGMLHYPGGLLYIMIATIAGLFYGYALQITGRIEASIIVHFLVNFSHILLFTYPRAV